MDKAISALADHPDFYHFLNQLKAIKMLNLSNLRNIMTLAHTPLCHSHKEEPSPHCFYCRIVHSDQEMVLF